MIADVIRNANAGAEQWEKICKDCSAIKENFHWRASSSYITLVANNKIKPMNGIHCNVFKDGIKKDGAKTWAFKTVLSNIKAKLEKNDDKLDKNFLEKLGFTADHSDEDELQADFISDLLQNRNDNLVWLYKQLDEKQISFLGSEIILYEKDTSTKQEPRKRIDVVAVGEKAIYIIEMKDNSNSKDDPVKQVKGYISKYKNDEYFIELLKIYAGGYGITLKEKLPLIGVTIKGYKPGNMKYKKEGEIHTFSEN